MSLGTANLGFGFKSNRSQGSNGNNVLNCHSSESQALSVFVVGRTMTAKDVRGLIPGICEYVKLSQQRDFADMIKIKSFDGRV